MTTVEKTPEDFGSEDLAGEGANGATTEGGQRLGAAGSESDVIDSFQYDDDICRKFAIATLVWAVVATAAGLLVAMLLLIPKMFTGVEWLSFGRLRPLHTNAAIFAFAGNAVFAAVYYSTQRLCKARMWSDTLSRLHFWGWQLIILAAVVTLPLGITQSKKYAELEWPIDLAIVVVWLGFFGANFFMTLAHRRERHMYVTLWFYIATIVTVTILHVFNNLVVPIGLWKSYPIYAGVQDALMQWWYGQNLMAFFLTMPFLGLMYYFLPKAAGRPVYSYKLSIIHFWSLVFLYIWAGPHHLHYTALPQWASTLGMLFGIMLWMPSWAGVINGLRTLRGAWHKVSADPVLKFFVVGITFYGISSFEDSLLSIKAVNGLAHYTDWTIAHVHTGALGWNGMMSFGMLYWLAPRLFQTKLWSDKLANLHFWLATIGILLFVVPIYIAGVIEGYRWGAMDSSGQLVYPEFITTIIAVKAMWGLRFFGGLFFVGGTLMMAFNYFMTWTTRPSIYEQSVHQAPRLAKTFSAHDIEPASHYDDAPVLGFANWLDAWGQMEWHRRWERLPLKFTMITVAIVVVASLLEIIPMFVIRGNVPTISTVKPYTPLELAGRDIYIAEGCYNCHSQMVRPMVAETKRYGEYSKAGEFVYDHPFQWGSRRIGPDLAREGGRQSSLWHYLNLLRDPQTVNKQSVMPAYIHLFDTSIDFNKVTDRVVAAHKLGAEYTEEELSNAPEIARKQAEVVAADVVSQGGPVMRGELMTYDCQAVALIAYLQRLGTDLYAAAEPAISEAPADGETPATDTETDGKSEP